MEGGGYVAEWLNRQWTLPSPTLSPIQATQLSEWFTDSADTVRRTYHLPSGGQMFQGRIS